MAEVARNQCDDGYPDERSAHTDFANALASGVGEKQDDFAKSALGC